MKSLRTVAEINERIRAGKAVVLTSEEMVDLVAKEGVKGAARKVDVVTTGTFGPMCSSGAFLNFGHSKPRIKAQRVWLNDVEAYAGIAAVDIYIGATQLPEDDPMNRPHPGEFRYGGAHVIADLVAGKEVAFRATAHGTDCYPRRELEATVSLRDFNEAYLFNPRNCYQNYNCAVNLSDRIIYTYMGVLKPRLGNANYCSAGVLSPLLRDPRYRTIGIGSRIFLGGGIGYVAWQGTQHSPGVPRTVEGVPTMGAGTLALIGDLKGMSPRYVVGVSFQGYGVSMGLGIGIPIPILDEDLALTTGLPEDRLFAQVIDYSADYPQGVSRSLGEVSYRELRSGRITVEGKKVPTVSLSSLSRAREIATALKEWIAAGEFLLTEPVTPLPSAESGYACHGFTGRIRE